MCNLCMCLFYVLGCFIELVFSTVLKGKVPAAVTFTRGREGKVFDSQPKLRHTKRRRTHYHAQLGLSDNGCATKELVVCYVVWLGSMRGIGLKRFARCTRVWFLVVVMMVIELKYRNTPLKHNNINTRGRVIDK